MTPTREEVIRAARECGAFLELSTTPEKDMAFLLRFAERFYEAGAAAARESLPRTRVGNLTVSRHPKRGIWLRHDGGEGMQTDEDKLYQHLMEFFDREF